MSDDDAPNVDIPDDVPMEDLEPWKQHMWRTPDLSADDRASAIAFVRWFRGNVPGDTPRLRKLYDSIGEALNKQEGQ
jgi:hypothetical protein